MPVAGPSKQKTKATPSKAKTAASSSKKKPVATRKKRPPTPDFESDTEPEPEQPITLSQKARGKQRAIPEEEEESEADDGKKDARNAEGEDDVLPVVRREDQSPEVPFVENQVAADAANEVRTNNVQTEDAAAVEANLREAEDEDQDMLEQEEDPEAAADDIPVVEASTTVDAIVRVDNEESPVDQGHPSQHDASVPAIAVLRDHTEEPLSGRSSQSTDAKDIEAAEQLLDSLAMDDEPDEEVDELVSDDDRCVSKRCAVYVI